jgi:hypothetical protein
MASIKTILQILKANKNIIQAKKWRSQSHFWAAVYTQSAVTLWLYHHVKDKLQNSIQANNNALLLRMICSWLDWTPRSAFLIKRPILFFSLALQPSAGYGLLVHEVS